VPEGPGRTVSHRFTRHSAPEYHRLASPYTRASTKRPAEHRWHGCRCKKRRRVSCRTRCRQSCGHVWVESRPRAGTTFPRGHHVSARAPLLLPCPRIILLDSRCGPTSHSALRLPVLAHRRPRCYVSGTFQTLCMQPQTRSSFAHAASRCWYAVRAETPPAPFVSEQVCARAACS
jgi:hypothetical protein